MLSISHARTKLLSLASVFCRTHSVEENTFYLLSLSRAHKTVVSRIRAPRSQNTFCRREHILLTVSNCCLSHPCASFTGFCRTHSVEENTFYLLSLSHPSSTPSPTRALSASPCNSQNAITQPKKKSDTKKNTLDTKKILWLILLRTNCAWAFSTTGSFCLFDRVEDGQPNVRSASLLGRHACVRKKK